MLTLRIDRIGTSNRHARASIGNNAITERKNGTNQKRQRLLAEYTRNTGTEWELFSDHYCMWFSAEVTCMAGCPCHDNELGLTPVS